MEIDGAEKNIQNDRARNDADVDAGAGNDNAAGNNNHADGGVDDQNAGRANNIADDNEPPYIQEGLCFYCADEADFRFPRCGHEVACAECVNSAIRSDDLPRCPKCRVLLWEVYLVLPNIRRKHE